MNILAISFIAVAFLLKPCKGQSIEDAWAMMPYPRVRNVTLRSVREQILGACPDMTSRNLPADYAIQYNRTLKVEADFIPLRFVEINDVEQTMSLYGTMLFVWIHNCNEDDICNAIESPQVENFICGESGSFYFRVSPKAVPTDPVWVPRFSHANAKDDPRPFDRYGHDIEIYLDRFPNSLWYATGTYTTSCENFSFKTFPFDELDCEMRFDGHEDAEQVEYFVDPIEIADDFIGDSEIWQFVSANSKTVRIKVAKGQNYSMYSTRLVFEFRFKRNYIYYVQSVFMPVFGLFFLQISAFLMPSAMPDRPAFSMTVLLAFAVILSLVTDMFPKTSETIYAVLMISIKFSVGMLDTIYMLFACAIGESRRANRIVVKSMKLTLLRAIDLVVASISAGSVLIIDITLFVLMIEN